MALEGEKMKSMALTFGGDSSATLSLIGGHWD